MMDSFIYANGRPRVRMYQECFTLPVKHNSLLSECYDQLKAYMGTYEQFLAIDPTSNSLHSIPIYLLLGPNRTKNGNIHNEYIIAFIEDR